MDVSLQAIAELLQTKHRLVLTAHMNPDGDSLGSMLGLYHSLKGAGKEVTMLLDDDIPALYHFLPGFEDIQRPSATTQTADLLIVLDASDVERIGAVKTAINAPILNIDHHLSNTHFADYWYVDVQAAATGEIVYELLQVLQLPLTASIAASLYTAIATDCGFFRYANTTAKTMRYAAALMEAGAKPPQISEALETKSMNSVLALSKVLDTLEFFAQGRIACISLDTALVASLENTEGFINYPRCIEGVEIAVMFKEASADVTRVSMRSRDIDVSRIALSFGGGGHRRAAGCSVAGPLSTAKPKVLAALQALVEEELHA